ncbi:unnamed protein product, partial [Meganyctiphanes norvegica]
GSQCIDKSASCHYADKNACKIYEYMKDICPVTCNECGDDTYGVKCGIETNAPTRIINGVDVEVARKYSWQVGLKDTNHRSEGYFCGGSIITNQHILTAAHCVIPSTRKGSLTCAKPVYRVFVGIGDHKQEETTDNFSDFLELIPSMNIIPHPEYNCFTLDNDLAIIKLKMPIDLQKHAGVIHPVCLPKDDSKTYQGLTATSTGWGSVVGYNEGEEYSPNYPNILQEVQVSVMNNSKCIKQRLISDNMLCTANEEGYAEGGKDACQGDSGGPLFVKQKGRHVQIGITSDGKGCASKENPGVYSRVSKFIDWIEKEVEPETIFTLP